MQRDEPDDAPKERADEAHPPIPEWTVEDFDNFAPFELDAEPADTAEPGAGEESSQGTLEFGLAPEEERADAAQPGPDAEPERAAEPAGEPPADIESDPAGLADEGDEEEEPTAGPGYVVVPFGEGDPEVEPPDATEEDEFEDTVESGFEGGQEASVAPAEEEEDVDVPDFASFTSEEYMQTTTQEFVDLAEEMARAATTEHVQSAISAQIPGLESGIVGLDDVVAAAGTDPRSIPVAPRSNLATRVFTALALALIFFASLYDPVFVGLFILVVLMLSAGEFYAAFVRVGRRPVALFGLLGTLGALAGTWAWGLIAVPVAVAATLVATLLLLAIARERVAPLTTVALTVLGTAWVGGMGAFILDMVQDDDYGWLIVATIVTVAVMDIASFFVGRRIGRHRLAPRVSPKKTIEGLIAGMLVAVLVGVAFGLREPFDLGSGLALGLIVALVAPLGDLAVSVMKRSIGAKDMGTLLPGHGGLLDRIDAMLFVIPLAWIAFRWTELLT